jgi:hypothetical protein
VADIKPAQRKLIVHDKAWVNNCAASFAEFAHVYRFSREEARAILEKMQIMSFLP